MDKKSFLGVIFFIVLISGCGGGNVPVENSPPVNNPPLSSAVPAPGFENVEEMIVKSDGIKEFNIIAKQWNFNPSVIEVNQGDSVKLNIESVDVAHGFALSAFGVNSRLYPGTTTVVEFDATKKGEFTFFCSVQCGSGHGGMRGRLIVN